MGRPAKPHACSRCQRTPEQLAEVGVTYYASNRKCATCLKVVNHENYLQRKLRRHLEKANLAALTSNPNNPVEGQRSEDGTFIFTDGHWEPYDADFTDAIRLN